MPPTYKEKELANVGASVATSCKPCTEYHFNKVRDAGASDEEIGQAITQKEIQSVLDAALFIKGEAAHYVGQIVRLREEKDELQRLLEELE